MAHAPIQIDLPELPEAIRLRLVPYRAARIEEGLRSLGYWHPGLFDAMQKTIALLAAEPGVESTSVDYDEDDVLFPVTIWAQTVFTGEERFRHMVILEGRAEAILRQFPELVLVAIQ